MASAEIASNELTATELTMSLLRAQINGDFARLDATEKPSDELLSQVYRLSSAHDLAHIVGSSLDRLGFLTSDTPTKTAFSKAQNTAIFRYIEQSDAYESICSSLEKENIPYVPLKGSVIRDLYPSPEERSACDIDILVRESDMQKAENTIKSLGFEQTGKCFHDIAFARGTVKLELHYNITEDDARFDRLLSHAWEYAEESDTCKHNFTNEFFVFHFVAHTCDHFLHGGCGIKPLLDLWIIQKKLVFDEEKLLRLLEECELVDFYDAMCQLSRVWFDGESHTDLTKVLQKYIISGGVYGSRENKFVAQKNENGTKAKYVRSRMFMPRRHLEMLYPVLKEHPILLPLCQVRRWIRVIKKGRVKKAIGELAYVTAMPCEKDKEIENMLKSLKL